MKITSLLQKLFSPLQNCEAATLQLCRLLDVAVTKTTLQKQLEEHPDYPSLLPISDVLKNIGVQNIALKIESIDNLYDYPLPLIAQISLRENNIRDKYFAVVSALTKDTVTFYHPIENQVKTISVQEFKEIFVGYVLLAEVDEHADEKDYAKNLRKEKRTILTKILAASAVPALVLIAGIICFINHGTLSLAAIVYTLLTFIGTVVSVLLLWYEVDKHNPALQQICTGGKKTNCNAILSSDAAKIFGISWGAIGFTYFAGSLITLLVSGIYSLSALTILAWLNVLALPYIVFSLYYQSQIAKQWCVLCLAVQIILALQFVTAFWGGFHVLARHAELVSASTILTIAVCFTIPFLIVSLLLPALRTAKESKQNKNELQRLKHNPQIFEALLAKQKAVTEPADGLGITLGNPDAKYKLIKVCNPYCGPCASAHPAIEELLENNPDVQVQIIFTATDDEKDFRNPPVKHLLAIAAKNNETQTKQALDDWYMADKKDYDVFAVQHPLTPSLEGQGEAVKAMDNWCNKMEIAFTPTFFVNGHQLPELYSVADLKYFLSV